MDDEFKKELLKFAANAAVRILIDAHKEIEIDDMNIEMDVQYKGKVYKLKFDLESEF